MWSGLLNHRWTFWMLLALPAAAMLAGFLAGGPDVADLLHPSGETSARLMIAAMMLAPLKVALGPRRWIDWMLARRRWLGVAAFGYALLHLILYLIDMGNLADVLAEFLALGIWTGWAAMVIMLALALTSNDNAMRALKSGWKRLQRFAWPAAFLTVLHWIFVHNNPGPALVHFIPLALLFVLRAFNIRFNQPQGV